MAVMVESLLRTRVLSLYRRLIQLSKSWEAIVPAETPKEREYIKTETRTLFRRNKNEQGEIESHLREGETRIELALHYRNPYPRMTNIPQNVLPPTSKRKLKGRERALQQAKPIHLKSYKDTE